MSKITLQNLRKTFDTPHGVEVAVDDIDLVVEEGEFVAIVGPSGCGKTTTLRCVAGLEYPTSGKIIFGEEDVTDVPENKRNLAMMFQNIALYPHMTIIDNIAYPLKVSGVPKSERYEEARVAAKIVEIEELLDKYPGDLSGGQRQRAALARTVIQDPVAFLMDEPLSDLDAKLKVVIRKEIQQVHRRLGKPTIYVTHDQEEAITMSDRIAIMNDGGIEQVGTRDEIYNYPTNTFVAEFIGNPSMNFLDGAVTSVSDGVVTFEVHGETIAYTPADTTAYEGLSEITIGIRPHDVTLSHEPEGIGFEGELFLLEPLDDRTMTTIHGPDGELQAMIPTEHPFEEGETVYVNFDPADLYPFSAETSELLPKADASGDKFSKVEPNQQN